MKIDIFRSFDDLVLWLGRYVGRSTLPALAREIRDTGAVWCYYGTMLSEGMPVVRIIQVCRLSSGAFAARDRGYCRAPNWTWVADADALAGKAPRGDIGFATAAEILKCRRPDPVTIPQYARPDVPAGE